MYKLIVVVLSVLLSFIAPFSGPANKDNIGCTAVDLPGERSTIYISFEHYQMHDGWTPVVLSIGELNCLLWMDKDGNVSELPEPGVPFIEPVCAGAASLIFFKKNFNFIPRL